VERKVPELLHCPECGLRLGKAEWQACNFDYRICPGRHLWDISTGLISGVNFTRVPIMTCWCGEDTPERYMKQIDKRRMCQKCFDQEAEAWRMDGQESFARLEITPTVTLEGTYYKVETTIQIRPYPNPAMGGGWFGIGMAEGDAELVKVIESFHAQADELKEKGLSRVEVLRHDQETITVQPKLIEKQEKQEPKPETQQLSLI
jgi:hypothetical protein